MNRAQRGHRNLEHIHLSIFTQLLRSMEKTESSCVQVSLLNQKYKCIIQSIPESEELYL